MIGQIALAIGLSGWGWGLYALYDVFTRERTAAAAGLDAERRVLVSYAHRALEERLRRDLERAAVEVRAALIDPRLDDQSLLLVEPGGVRLPRAVEYAPGEGTPARDLFAQIRVDPTSLVVDDEGPWADRVRLGADFARALQIGDRAAVESAFRAVLGHRTRYVLRPERALPHFTALLVYFTATGQPDRGTMRALLRDGLSDGRGGRLVDLQRALLDARAAFTASDFAFLVDRIVEMSRDAGARADDFAMRARQAPPRSIPRLVATAPGPRLSAGGVWFVEPVARDAWRGVAVDVPTRLVEVGEEMSRRGLIVGDDALRLPRFDAFPGGSVADVSLSLHAPRLIAAEIHVVARYRLKLALGAVVGLFALAIVGLIWALDHRARRFVELKNDFVATVSHELRTPLASIRLMAETLDRRFEGVERARDYPARIVSEVDSLSFLVENILSFNRLDKGRWRAERRPVALDDVFEALRRDPDRYTFGDVEWRLGDLEGVFLEGDAELLQLLAINLARNACQYCDRTPARLEVSARSDSAGGLIVSFADNGTGLPAGADREIFDPFWRGAPDSGRGSGLGLAICRRVMQWHGGDIRVAQTSPDGTTFELVFTATSS